MLWRGIFSILLCMMMSSAAYAQGQPAIKTAPPRLSPDLKGLGHP